MNYARYSILLSVPFAGFGNTKAVLHYSSRTLLPMRH